MLKLPFGTCFKMSLSISQSSVSFNIDNPSKAVVQLRNTSPANIAFKIKCNQTKYFSVRPNLGCLRPNSNVALEFSMIGQIDRPELLSVRFLVEYSEQSEPMSASKLHEVFREQREKQQLKIPVYIKNSADRVLNDPTRQSTGVNMFASMTSGIGESRLKPFDYMLSSPDIRGESALSYLSDRKILYQKSPMELCEIIDEKDKSLYLTQAEVEKTRTRLNNLKNKLREPSMVIPGPQAHSHSKKKLNLSWNVLLMLILSLLIGVFFGSR